MSSVVTIALTGGPCGGKSTSLSVLDQELTNKGYKVFIIEEMATNVIKSGANPGVVGLEQFQKMLVALQYERNKVYTDMANKLANETNSNIILIFDRGIPDCKGYVSDSIYSKILTELGLTATHVMDFYDGVFHLVTAADGAIEFYTCENNNARTETPEQAIERDRGCLRAWTGHTHLRVIGNEGTFDKKIDKLLEEVYTLLGIPVPVEIERKYLIKMPDIEELKSKYDCTTVDIIQTYLVEKEKWVERRVRQRGVDGNYTFYYTEKQTISGMSRTEKERKISQKEYLQLLMEADTTLHQVKKKRTCFVCNGSYFELDTYPFWNDKAILEIELTNESVDVTLPECIELIEEVTDKKEFKNKSLAKNLGVIE